MEIKAITGDITEVKAGAIILGIFEEMEDLGNEPAKLDKALDGAITRLIREGEIKGTTGEISLIHSLGKLPASRVAIVGLGKKQELTLDRVRGVMAEACRYLQKKRITAVATTNVGTGTAGISAEASAQTVTEGAMLGTYTFRRHMIPLLDETGRRATGGVGRPAALFRLRLNASQ